MRIKHFLLKVLNFSFILHSSCDVNFDTFQSNSPVRISFLHLNIFSSHFYFLTYLINERKFSIFYKIKFEGVVIPVSSSDLKQKVNAFNFTLLGKSDLHDVQIDILKEKKSDNKSAISEAYNKASFFLGLITSVVGLFTFLLPTIVAYYSQSYLKTVTFWFLLASSLINIFSAGWFIYEVLNVKGYLRCSFKSLSLSKGVNFELLYHYYEWVAGDAERVKVISLLKNAIKYSLRALCFTLILWAFLQIFLTEKIIAVKPVDAQSSHEVKESLSLIFKV